MNKYIKISNLTLLRLMKDIMIKLTVKDNDKEILKHEDFIKVYEILDKWIDQHNGE